jgi:microcystin-dependent protein
MGTPFLGQITTFGFGFAPAGWALCNGQLLSINQYQALFALLGVQFGGDGKTTFGLPNLQGAFALGRNSQFPIGAKGGETTHTLSVNEMATHSHAVAASTGAANAETPAANYPTTLPGAFLSSANTTLSPGSTAAGSGQPHNNMPPYLAINFCIALTGIFPSRS